jgi:hypothetical protein
MKPSVYIETTIVSYLTAWPSRDVIRLSHEMITREWWDKRRPDFDLYVSDFVIQEASRGDTAAAAERMKALAGVPLLPPNSAALELTEKLAKALALPQRARPDAAHVAMSAVHGVSFLLTWNCTHIANAVLLPKIERTCQDAGFAAPRIVTPEMLLTPPEAP